MKSGLRAELLRREELDQAARRTDDHDVIAQVDAENLPWLREVVTNVGWPGWSMVGEDGARAAWLLAQHADSDPAFQRQCLELLIAVVKEGDASPAHMAYLTDRVLLAEGKGQVFGTQATAEYGQWVPRQLRDPETVDERRAAVDLGPLAEYLAGFTTQYGPPAPTTVACSSCAARIETWLPEPGEKREIICTSCGQITTFEVARPDAQPDQPSARTNIS